MGQLDLDSATKIAKLCARVFQARKYNTISLVFMLESIQ